MLTKDEVEEFYKDKRNKKMFNSDESRNKRLIGLNYLVHLLSNDVPVVMVSGLDECEIILNDYEDFKQLELNDLDFLNRHGISYCCGEFYI